MLAESFSRRGDDKSLWVEEVPIEKIAQSVGTPTYVYSRAAIYASYDRFSNALIERKLPHLVCVAVKANSNLSILSLLAKRGAGFDVVSGGELKRVLAAGGQANKVVFAGVGKTDEEIRLALDSGIRALNVESEAELRRINEIASESGKKAPVALRVNPNVDAQTHPYLATGMAEAKFGIEIDKARELYLNSSDFPAVEFVGVGCHLGTTILIPSVFTDAFVIMRNFVDEIRSSVPTLRSIDLGGGLGVRYNEETPPDINAYADLVAEHFGNSGLDVLFEPGRYIFANAGVLLSRVLYLKRNSVKNFVIIDGAMNDLIRPSLYQAYHGVEPVALYPGRKLETVDIVGPVCESGDFLAKARELPEFKPGELLVVRSAGAYGFMMASNYCSRTLAAEVLVEGDNFRVVNPRQTIDEVLARQKACLEEGGAL